MITAISIRADWRQRIAASWVEQQMRRRSRKPAIWKQEHIMGEIWTRAHHTGVNLQSCYIIAASNSQLELWRAATKRTVSIDPSFTAGDYNAGEPRAT
jgi:hypothetical protein